MYIMMFCLINEFRQNFDRIIKFNFFIENFTLRKFRENFVEQFFRKRNNSLFI